MKTQRTALFFALLLLGLVALGTSAATAQTELFFATGVDSTGWAQAQSNADGHVLIESPQYPRGLWLHCIEPVEDRLIGWEGLAAFLREREQGQAGRVVVQIESSTTLITSAVEVENPKAIETLVANLNTLYLHDNQIVDITPLNQLNNLETLDLYGNQIVDIAPLQQLINLNRLTLHDNQIVDLSPLVANTGLGEGDWLNLENNPLSDQARNEQIPALQARGVNVHY